MPVEPAQTVSEAQRKIHVDLADAENRIDGLFRDPQTDAVFEAYVAGEIAVADIVPRLHALLGL
jgi:Antitoxin VbhA